MRLVAGTGMVCQLRIGGRMSSGGGSLSSVATKVAFLVGGVVLAAVLAAAQSADGASHPGVVCGLAAILAAAVAGWAVYAVIQTYVIGPLRRLAAGSGHAGGSELAALKAVIDASDSRSGRLMELEAQTASLRHDIRGILSSALLSADRLTEHADPKVAKSAEIIVRSVTRAADRLASTRPTPCPAATGMARSATSSVKN